MPEANVETVPSNKLSRLWTPENFKYVPPAFLTLILLVGQFTYGILDSYLNLVVSVVTCLISEIILARTVLHTRKNLASAYISGISIGILIRSNMMWPYAMCALLSILSKYVLRYKGRHLWNPSNFGVSWMLFMAPLAVAGLSIQWGNNLAAMAVIWCLGLVIVHRAKRLHVSIAYVISFAVLAWVRSLITHDAFLAELSPLTGPMYQLFVFFMVTEPATGVSTKRGRILVVIGVALVEFVLRLYGYIYAPFYALFLVGPICKYFDLRKNAPKLAKNQ